MNIAKIIAIIFAVIIVVLLGILIFVPAAKGPTLPEEPLPGISADGRLRVILPPPEALTYSPLIVAGSVTGGGWFFEASFPVTVLDGDGSVLAKVPVQAQGEWMTTGTVPFSASITFPTPKYATGTVVFEKDNPSGLPEHAMELRIPVRFK